MKKVTLVHGSQCKEVLSSASNLVMFTIGADCMLTFDLHGFELAKQHEHAEEVADLLQRNDHVAVLMDSDSFYHFRYVLQRLLNADDKLKDTEIHYRRFGGIVRQLADKEGPVVKFLKADHNMPELTATQQKMINDILSQETEIRHGGKVVKRGRANDNLPAAVIVYGPKGCGKTTHAEQIAKELSCDVIQDGDKLTIINPYQTVKRTLFLTSGDVQVLADRLKRNAAIRGEDPSKLRIELYQFSDLRPHLKTDFTGLEQRAAAFSRDIQLTIPCGVRNIRLREDNAVLRGVAHGATMYAMGIAEGLLMGGKELTIVVDGDDEARALNLNYPFIRWDCGRVHVRTVSEMMMAAAGEGKGVLGMTAWVVDVKPASLNALLELQQWESFIAVLSGPNFDTFAQERSV